MNKSLIQHKETTTLVALGSNAGNPVATLNGGIAAMAEVFGPVTSSHFYQTPAFPAGSGPDFVNAAVVFQAQASPQDCLAILHQIEAEFGRTRTKRWGQRTLDLDLIAKGAAILPDPDVHRHWRDLPMEDQMIRAPDRLILPHPRLQDRLFVLIPLADVVPDWVHPVLERSISEMIAEYPPAERAEIRRI